MNKLLLTTLTTAMLATSGFAGDQQEQTLNWGGDIKVEAGASVTSTQGRTFTNTMGLEKGVLADSGNNIEEKTAAFLKIAENEQVGDVVVGEGITMTLQGGTIQATEDAASGEGDRPKPRIILNGKLLLDKVVSEGENPDTTYPTLKDVAISSDNQEQSAKLLDMGSLRELPKDQNDSSKHDPNSNLETDETVVSVNTISGVSIEADKGIKVKLPFNCDFGKTGNDNNLDLSNAANVQYDYLHVEDITPEANPDNIGGSVDINGTNTAIKDIADLNGNVIDERDEYFGNYAENANLGVSLPMKTVQIDDQDVQVVDLKDDQNPNGKVEATKVSDRTDFTLGIVATTIQNATELTGKYLNTNAFDDPNEPQGADSHVLTAEQEYKFGFAGTHPVSISNSGENTFKAIFRGDNQYYVPEAPDAQNPGQNIPSQITLPAEVEFAGTNSLFPFTQDYGRGVFAAGTDAQLANEVKAGTTAKFANGFSLGANHTLTVKGTLIG